jgi:carbon monoxide dehydrogenase subunit G
MRVEGSYAFDRPAEDIFPLLKDPEVLKKILPGCEELEEVGDGQYKGTISIKIGPVQGKFNGDVRFSDLEEPERGALAVKGQGPSGFVNGTGRFTLENRDEGCMLAYEGDAQIGGRLASVGQRLLDTSAKAIITSGLDGLAQHLAASDAAGEPGDQTDESDAPSHAAFARDVARNMAQETLGETGTRRLATWALVATGAVVVLVLLRRVFRARS